MKKFYLLFILLLSTNAESKVVLGLGVSEFSVFDITVPLVDISYEYEFIDSNIVSAGILYSSGGSGSEKEIVNQADELPEVRFEYNSYNSFYLKYQYNINDTVGLFLRPEYKSFDTTTTFSDSNSIEVQRDGFTVGLGVNFIFNDKFIVEVTNINEVDSESLAIFAKYKFD